MISSCQSSPLGTWLTAAGGHFHHDLAFKPDEWGSSIYSTASIEPHQAVVSCPFSLAVTPELARRAVQSFLKSTTEISNHSAIILYLSLHRIVTDELEFIHSIYIDALPQISEMRTPLYYNAEEMDFLAGTNLYGATKDRESSWKVEWEALKAQLDAGGKISGERLTWELFLFFSTILSSRAFPSSLIKTQNTSDATPILFPGVDMLNHSYGRKVSWISENDTFKIILDDGLSADVQCFNNYGPKPNEELLLGYGFTTPNNLSDVVALKVGLPPPPPAMFAQLASKTQISIPDLLEKLNLSDLRSFIDRTALIPASLLSQMRLLLSSPEEREEIEKSIEKLNAENEEVDWKEVLAFVSWENELDVFSMIEEMVENKLDLLNSVQEAGESVRPDVKIAIEEYRIGQLEILDTALKVIKELFEVVAAKAREAGVDVDMEDFVTEVEEQEE